jgi:hypothetical protein
MEKELKWFRIIAFFIFIITVVRGMVKFTLVTWYGSSERKTYNKEQFSVIVAHKYGK